MFQWFHNVGCFTDFAIWVVLDWFVCMYVHCTCFGGFHYWVLFNWIPCVFIWFVSVVSYYGSYKISLIFGVCECGA